MNRFHIYSWRTSKHRKYVSEEHLCSSKYDGVNINNSDLLEHFNKDNVVRDNTDNINDNNNNQSVEVDKLTQELYSKEVPKSSQDADDVCEYSEDEENSLIDSSSPQQATDAGVTEHEHSSENEEDNLTGQCQPVYVSTKSVTHSNEEESKIAVSTKIEPSKKAALLAKLSEIDNNADDDGVNIPSDGRFEVDVVRESPTHASPPNDIAARKTNLMMELFGVSEPDKPLKTSLRTSSSSLNKSVKFKEEDQINCDG